MPFFKKKPVIISAIQWTGDNLREIADFISPPKTGKSINVAAWESYEELVQANGLMVHTEEGPLKASVGDWIIKGIKGEFYPCKPDIFEATYDPMIKKS